MMGMTPTLLSLLAPAPVSMPGADAATRGDVSAEVASGGCSRITSEGDACGR